MLPDMFVDLGNPQSAEPILHKIFPGWVIGESPNSASVSTTSLVDGEDPIIIEQLTGGITNKLFQATHTASGTKVLIRAYGKGTSAIIHRDREVSTHMHLHSMGLAPPLFARFGNGLVYSYMPGKAVNYQYLSDPQVSAAIARRIGEWHTKLNPETVESLIVSQSKARGEPTTQFSHNVWELLEAWIDCMPANVVKAYSQDDLRKELAWIRENIGSRGGKMVVAHCDLLAGNVIVPEDFVPTPRLSTPSPDSQGNEAQDGSHDSTRTATNDEAPLEVNFIDYEYAMLAPRAFDLANHFMEWQGFECVTELIPDPSPNNPVLRRWASAYLETCSSCGGTAQSNTDAGTTDEEIDTLLTEVLTFWGMPGFYWGIWSSIQSVISDIDFDYANYANSRLQEYTNWKKSYVSKT